MLDPLARSIAQKIISTEIPAGSHLGAANLANELGVSRTPVREALRTLAALGLVEVRGNRGAFVVDPDDLSATELVDLVATRGQLEPWLMAEAAIKHTEGDLARIDDALAAGTEALDSGRTGDLNLAHHALLLALAKAAHNDSALLALAPLHYRTCLAFARVAHIVLSEGWPLHRAIRDAIAERDPETAERLHHVHLRGVVENLQRGID